MEERLRLLVVYPNELCVLCSFSSSPDFSLVAGAIFFISLDAPCAGAHSIFIPSPYWVKSLD